MNRENGPIYVIMTLTQIMEQAIASDVYKSAVKAVKLTVLPKKDTKNSRISGPYCKE